MKALSFEQMEGISGGDFDLCDAAIIISTESAYSSIFWAVGPVGWGLAALSLASLVITAYQCDPRNQ